ncbi:sugar nucleotidyltransferase [Natronomonas pharaonis DSM 2160]|uniref:Bifunctional protein GlmU n=1 Tax=Natronomonas pharaonis (strain ATCC 35678 / DSM 2160 / CIP 103997 / JCM 8858 / NBRC 14720 / NCIMB 2260 / Gabara) TaxID=348780 RepID=A0A1U7EYU8_NATPD|nr:bifunctional sugar-1-phosphate nucleotidylyltransferase/acetyltransferase [Natronomonas pharaonis]CAI50417.1 sugar nucleotidyltransferase [Natronomonas pharaonis DSM 2160]
MKAAILAAGEGRRLRPLTNRRPKPMLPVGNRPILEHVVAATAAAGLDGIVLVVGYERDRIQTHFGDGDDWDIDIEYAVQKRQLGTGHAVQQVSDRIDGEFLVLNGDRIVNADLIERMAGDVAAPAVAVTRVDQPQRYGIVDTDGDRLRDIDEKPAEPAPSEVINAGVYRFSQSVFETIERTDPDESGERTLPDALAAMAADGDVRAVRYRGTWLDVTQLWDLLATNNDVLDRQGATTRGDIAPSAAIADRVDTASGVAVGPNSTLKRGTTLGANATIGANVVISNAIVMADATIADGAVIRDCIIGENATVGPNTTITGGPAKQVVIDGEVHAEVPLGGVIGDNATLGGNVSVLPGTVLGDGSTVADNATISGTIEPDTEVRRG